MAAENDGELDILIRTMAETYGADEVEKSLNRIKDGAGGAGEGMSRMNFHGREMRHIFRELNHILPGLGLSMKGLFNPEAAGMILTLVALQQAVKLFEQYKKKAEEAIDAQAKMFVSVWEAQHKSADAAKDAWSEINHQVEQMIRNTDALKHKQDEALAVMEAQDKAQAETAQGDKLRAEELERQSAARHQAALQDIADQDVLALKQADAALNAAKAAREAGAPKAQEAIRAQAYLDAHKEAVQKKEAEIINQRALIGAAEKQELPTGMLKAALDRMTAELSDMMNAQVANRALVDAHARAEKKLADAESEAAEEVKKRFGEMKSAREAAEKGRAVLAAGGAGRVGAELFNIDMKPGSVAGGTVISGIRAAEAFAHGDKLTSEQDKTISAIIRGLRAAGQREEGVRALLEEMADLHVDHEQKIRDLLAGMKILKQQIKSTSIH